MDVRDAAEGIIALLAVKPQEWKSVYNLGNQWRYTIVKIAERVRENVKKYTPIPVRVEIEEKYTYMNSGMDSSLFYKDTKWNPKYDIEEMLKSLFDYFKDQ